jgi:hypothetical protein
MDVAVTLSTARPSLALVIPELDPWYIGPRPVPWSGANRWPPPRRLRWP